ncbi:acyltransferase family protein [Phenylobacterium sp.]|jgi:surface polysaccharide O-acyltransferase-like enzyme|uniref:acyltransferase family protein n=1 Tax=Phenylobacterium sp. TaxID=1871053 RepID=UPI002F92A63F
MTDRKHHLDWLRVLAFALLILFHTGLLYVTWAYNLKSPRLVPWLEWPMSALGAWRMVMIFVISGVASRFLLGKLGAGGFAWNRLLRLQPVILFGMFVVIPPQTWIELVDKGVTQQGYLDFWLGSYLRADQSLVAPLGKTVPTWDHLWFLVYLFAYAMVLSALFGAVGREQWARFEARLPLAGFLLVPPIMLAAGHVVIDRWAPQTWSFVNDWGAHLIWIAAFSAGVLAAGRGDFWRLVEARRRGLALAAVALLAVNLACRAWAMSQPPHGAGSLAYWVSDGLYGWATVLAVFGYGARYLNRPSAVLSYLNEAVLPIYVLHQPILLISAYLLFPVRLPLPLEGALLVLITAGPALAIYHLAIRPIGPMRFLFGVKPKPAALPRKRTRMAAEDVA